MKKAQKIEIVEDLARRIARARMALLSEHHGISVAESTELRRRLRAARGELKIVKNTLFRRALRETPFAPLGEKLGGPVGVVLSYDEPVTLLKAFNAATPDLKDKLQIRAAMLDGQVLGPAEIEELAKLPPREELLGRLLALLKAPAERLVRVLNEPGARLVRVLDSIGKKAAEASPAQPAPSGE